MAITIETELLTDTETTKYNLSDLQNQYNSTKSNASNSVKSLTDSFTLEGMDSINELVSEAMGKIKTFVDNGKEKTTTGKALALASKIPWAGKWLDKSVDAIEEEKLKEKTINEIIDSLIDKITTKREEVMNFVEAAKDRNLEAISKASTAIKNIEKLIGN